MTVSSYFSADYVEARDKFLTACGERSLNVDSRLNPNAKGARGEDLYTDIARIGPANTAKTLVLMSGTHGVEGYCGSGAQTGFLREGYFADLDEDVSVVLVHALNPYGFSHDRRVTEDNVDLNRNFLDFSVSERPASEYSRIHEFILPDDWGGPAHASANKQLASFIAQDGMKAFQAAVSGGQYAYRDGIFYGGDRPTWSNETFRSVLREYAGTADTVGLIDFHTGLGPYGYGELIAGGSSDQKTLARTWYGDQVTDPDAGTSSSAPLVGTIEFGIEEALPDAQIAYIALEYGTRDLTEVLTALRGDNWLYHKGELDSEQGRELKSQIKDAFYPDQDDWKSMIWSRACDVTQMALTGLRAAA
ncbi:MAG: M14 family metallopeptidase [Henriciella sp.]|nr:M14 family metallopeptidase [Henriciella sp.]